MDTLLIAATGLSLAMAIGMAILVLKLLREERRRSDARVATLIAMAADDSPARHVAPGAWHAARKTEHAAPGTRHVARETEHAAPGTRRVARETEHVTPGTWQAARESSPVTSDLFAEPERPSPWGARLVVAAALAAVVSGAGYLALSGSRSVPASGSVTGGAATAAAPLELLSLRHAEEPGGLAVSGLVQNPRAGAPLSRVIATAIAFGADGGFLASGRAPLDFTTLAPGTESPFVVHIPVTGAVARYRVGFRAEGGDVIAHVDKRGAPDAVARK
jgi:hypothetical protein